jgi:hypothetical protein
MNIARGNAAWWCALAALCVVLLAPLTIADVPPLLDYPNHMARLFALAFIPDDPVLARFYVSHWAIIPNLALDLTVPPLLRVFPVDLVGRAVAGVTLLLPVLGAAAYHRALTGRLSYWPLGSVLFAYNAAMLRGFLNFIVSIGLALLLAAVWVAWRERRPCFTIVTSAAGAVALFFCHLTGLLFFGILIGAHGLASMRHSRRGIAVKLAIVLGIFAIPAVLYLMSDLGQMNGDAEFRTLADKANAALTPVLNYSWPLDLATAFLCVAVPCLCVIRSWCQIPFQAALALIALLLLFIGLPAALKGTYDLDTRFIVMAAVILPACLVPAALPRRAAWAISLGFLLLFAARTTVLLSSWINWAGHLTAFRTVIASIQPGDVVLTVNNPPAPDKHRWTTVAKAGRLSDGTIIDTHLPALLVIEHRAWWPYLFNNPSQQPIDSPARFRNLAERIDRATDPIALLIGDPSNMRLVTHVLAQGIMPPAAEIEAAGLTLITRNDDAALFRVNRSPSPPSGR